MTTFENFKNAMTGEPKRPPSLVRLAMEAMELERQILVLAEANDGEIDQQLEAYLGSVEHEIEQKVDNYKFVMDRLEATSTDLAEKAAQFKAAAMALHTAKERLKTKIKETMVVRGVKEVRGVNWRFALTELAPKLEAPDLTRVPEVFVKVKRVYELDKDLVRIRLEAGDSVPGVTVTPSHALRPYVNKRD
jgi:hypothetical protein